MPRRLTDWIQSYIQFTKATEAPEAFHFWSAISTIASCVKSKVWFNQDSYKWTPNFYIVLVAPPGVVTKSTTIKIGGELAREVGVTFGPNVLTWQYLPKALSESREDFKYNDDFFPICPLTFQASELGVMINPQDREMIDMLVDLWDGIPGAWTKATKGSGVDVVFNPWINIIAGTTPSWLGSYFPKEMIGGGFASRCIFVEAFSKRRIIAYPKLQMGGWDMKLRNDLLNDLMHISTMVGDFRMTPDAAAYGIAWYEKVWKDVAAGTSELEPGYVARIQCHVHKLAMVLSLSYRDDYIISEREMKGSIAMMMDIEKHIRKVFGAISAVSESAELVDMLEVLRRVKKVTKSALYRQFMLRVPDPMKFESLITAASRLGYIDLVNRGDGQILVEYKGDPT